MKICAHVLVRNEERFLWYSVMSVIDHVDRLLLWDTGSTDKTPKIIEEIKKRYPEKVETKECGAVDPQKFSALRQEMLNMTDSDWVFILDGDEVWWEDSIKSVIHEIKQNGFDAAVSPFINVVGDMFHYQGSGAGKYEIDGKKGNITIRFMKRNLPGLKVVKPYLSEGFAVDNGELVQESGKVKRKFMDFPFLHLTHLTRSGHDEETMGRKGKVKHELGISFPKDYYYPEVFFRPRPEIVDSPWQRMPEKFRSRAFLETPLRKIKRKII